MNPHAASEAEAGRIRSFYAEHHPAWKRWPRGRRYLVDERRQLLVRATSALPMAQETWRICDVGCGTGDDLVAWRERGVAEYRLAGTELLADRAAIARERLPGADVAAVGGFDLPFPDAAFSLTTASLVLSSITDDAHRRHLFLEMCRVTAPGGVVAVYDLRFTRPRNPNVSPLTASRIGALPVPSRAWPAAHSSLFWTWPFDSQVTLAGRSFMSFPVPTPSGYG